MSWNLATCLRRDLGSSVLTRFVSSLPGCIRSLLPSPLEPFLPICPSSSFPISHVAFTLPLLSPSFSTVRRGTPLDGPGVLGHWGISAKREFSCLRGPSLFPRGSGAAVAAGQRGTLGARKSRVEARRHWIIFSL